MATISFIKGRDFKEIASSNEPIIKPSELINAINALPKKIKIFHGESLNRNVLSHIGSIKRISRLEWNKNFFFIF